MKTTLTNTEVFLESALVKGIVDSFDIVENGYNVVKGDKSLNVIVGVDSALIRDGEKLIEVKSSKLDNVLHHFIMNSLFGTKSKHYFVMSSFEGNTVFTDISGQKWILQGVSPRAANMYFMQFVNNRASDALIANSRLVKYTKLVSSKAPECDLETEVQLMVSDCNPDNYAFNPSTSLINSIGHTVVGNFVVSEADKEVIDEFDEKEEEVFGEEIQSANISDYSDLSETQKRVLKTIVENTIEYAESKNPVYEIGVTLKAFRDDSAWGFVDGDDPEFDSVQALLDEKNSVIISLIQKNFPEEWEKLEEKCSENLTPRQKQAKMWKERNEDPNHTWLITALISEFCRSSDYKNVSRVFKDAGYDVIGSDDEMTKSEFLDKIKEFGLENTLWPRFKKLVSSKAPESSINELQSSADTVTITLDNSHKLKMDICKDGIYSAKFKVTPNVKVIEKALLNSGYAFSDIQNGMTLKADDPIVSSVIKSAFEIEVLPTKPALVRKVEHLEGNSVTAALRDYGIDDAMQVFSSIDSFTME